MENCVFMRFEKAFCQACEACIHAERLHWDFLLTNCYCYGEAAARLGIDTELFVVNLESADVLFLCIAHWKDYIIYLEEIQSKNVLVVRPIHYYIVYKPFVDIAQKGHKQRVHISNFPF